jgi:hypothetical protein
MTVTWIGLGACDGSDKDVEATDLSADGDADTDSDSDADSDTDADTDTDPGPCGSIATFADGLSPTVEVHVAEDGSDTAGDGSAADPYASLERAVQDAAPGTAIRLAPGTYPGGAFIGDLRGTESAPIWIGGEPGQPKPVIEGGTSGLMLSAVSYLVVHDLELAGAGANGLNCDDAGDYANPLSTHHVVLRDLHIHDVGATGNEDCLKLSGVNDYAVLDSTFERCGAGGSGIDHVGCHHGIVARNTFVDPGSNGVQTKGGSEDIEIRWNHLVGGGDRALNLGGSTDLVYFRPPIGPSDNAEARDIRAVANRIEGGQAAIAFVGCVDCVAAHNTIVGPEHWTFRILQETVDPSFLPASNGLVINNLVAFERSLVGVDVNVGPDVDDGSFTWRTNWFYATDDPGQSAPSLPGTEDGTLSGTDPLLRADGSLDPASPAIGAGTPGADALGDYTGACWADPPAVGAFEG